MMDLPQRHQDLISVIAQNASDTGAAHAARAELDSLIAAEQRQVELMHIAAVQEASLKQTDVGDNLVSATLRQVEATDLLAGIGVEQMKMATGQVEITGMHAQITGLLAGATNSLVAATNSAAAAAKKQAWTLIWSTWALVGATVGLVIATGVLVLVTAVHR